jgi:hypothetical protein
MTWVKNVRKIKRYQSLCPRIESGGNKVKIRRMLKRKKNGKSGPEPPTAVNKCSKNKGFGDGRKQHQEMFNVVRNVAVIDTCTSFLERLIQAAFNLLLR